MLHVGLDIHSTRITICALDDRGQVAHRAQVRTLEEMLATLKGLPDRFEVCYEASCGYGHYHDVLRPLAARVLVAHPGQLRLIFRSKNKNDRNDAERLAKLLYLGETPTVHVPAPEVRAWRELINCRGQLVAKRTRAKNAARALLRSAGVVPPKKPGLWTKKGMACPGRPPVSGRGRLAGDPPVAECPGLLRADPAGGPTAAEDRPGGHGPLPGPCDVGAVAARHHLAGEREGRVTRQTFPEPRARGR